MTRPETQFAWNGDIALAYQVVGEGPVDILYAAGYVSNVELNWEHPAKARFLRRLARSARLIVTDPRGLGCSERLTPNDLAPLETMSDDLLAVLDAAGSDRCVVLATYQIGVAGCFLASTCPDRVAALVLYGAEANFLWSEDTPWQWTEEQYEELTEWFRAHWGTREGAEKDVREWDPSVADDPRYLDWWLRYQLLSQAPGAAAAGVLRYARTDIRSILPSIHVPTVVLVRPEVSGGYSESAAYLARQIPGARLVELPGRDSSLWNGDQAAFHRALGRLIDDIQREAAELDRVLATVLFTDIVGSTEHMARLGNRAWREVVEGHHAAVRALLERFRGVEVDIAGDGFFATFDGPAPCDPVRAGDRRRGPAARHRSARGGAHG